MASLIWTSIFAFLVFELILTFVLALPVPRKIRNYIARKVFKFHLGDKVVKAVQYIGVALAFALAESFVTHRRILARMEEENTHSGIGSYPPHEAIYHMHDKERRYKSERNMYLAGFALTLLFVISRITQLMQESVELEEEAERVRKQLESSQNTEEKPAADKKKD